MKRGRLPLTALRSFEAAGRLQSFTLAAEELFISQAAISRQVRELEAALGRALFERRHRSVVLTSAGESLLAILTPSFDDIGACLDRLQTRDRSSNETVTISAEPSFATTWLAQRLSSFRQKYPHVGIMLDADARLVEFRATSSTVAIRHSRTATNWSRVESKHLSDIQMVAVVAPALVQNGRPIMMAADLLNYPLLHEENRALWQRWFESAGVSSDLQSGTIYSDGGLILQAVLRGEGVGLLGSLFVQEELADGRLIQPFETSVPDGSYWLVTKSFAGLGDGAALFSKWLLAEFAADANHPVDQSTNDEDAMNSGSMSLGRRDAR